MLYFVQAGMWSSTYFCGKKWNKPIEEKPSKAFQKNFVNQKL